MYSNIRSFDGTGFAPNPAKILVDTCPPCPPGRFLQSCYTFSDDGMSENLGGHIEIKCLLKDFFATGTAKI